MRNGSEVLHFSVCSVGDVGNLGKASGEEGNVDTGSRLACAISPMSAVLG